MQKGSINEIISKFEICIESITETFDVAQDNKKKNNNMDYQSNIVQYYKKLKGFVINVLLIVSVLLLTLPIIVIIFQII